MIAIVIVLVAMVAFIVVFVAILKNKKKCSCIGKACGADDGCGNQCCDATQNQKCVNGKCCDNSCDGLTCKDKTGCGESCEKILCPSGGICQSDGTCCYQSNCPIGSCQLQCGKPCPCPNEGDVCVDGQCCTPDDCSTGICDTDVKCGKKCTCNNDYCLEDSCCQSKQCVYNDICDSMGEGLDTMFADTWGRFCKEGTVPTQKTCLNCSLVLPTWLEYKGSKALVPMSGTIHCEKCQDSSGKYVDADPVEIDKGAFYYENQGGVITPGPIDQEYCKNEGCGNCQCHNDADCQRWGCNKCVGLKCT